MALLNYEPAALRISKSGYQVEWSVIIDDVRVRQRARLNRISINALDTFAKELCNQINACLQLNQDPWIEIPFLKIRKRNFGKANGVVLQQIELLTGSTKYLNYLEKTLSRKDTIRGYKSIYNIFIDWIKLKYKIKYASEVTHQMITGYFDYLLYEKNYKVKTYNNNLTTLRSWWKNFFIKRNAAIINPFDKIGTIQLRGRKVKTKRVFTTSELKKIKAYILNTDYYFWVPCGCCFYCYIRRTEITRLKIKNIDLKNGNIIIHEDEAKDWTFRLNKIPAEFLMFLKSLDLDKLPQDYYLIGNDNFRPGPTPCVPTRITEKMKAYLEFLKIESQLTFYDLKHSGIFYFREHFGGSKEAAKEQAGHNSDKMHYTYYQPSQQIKKEFEILSIDNLIEGAPD